MFASYHAHVYYSQASRADAAWVRGQLDLNFSVQMGRWRDEPVGPHPEPMYQVAFEGDQFAAIVPWLMANRRGLTVLVHPNSGDALGDHDFRPLWMGEKLGLDLQFLRDIAHLPPEEQKA
ncbi:MAG: DOPA 4,5-dioxygenase family protein [bacterium]